MSKNGELIHFRKWCKETGFRNVAKLLGCHYEPVRSWVNDKKTPSIPTARRMLKAANGRIDPASFFNDRSQ